MSPVLQRVDADTAMFPVSYFDNAVSPEPSIASSSTTPALVDPSPTPVLVESTEPTPTPTSIQLGPAPTSVVEPTFTPTLVQPSHPVAYTFDASLIIVLLSFLVFVLWVVGIFLFAPSLRSQFIQYRSKKRQEKKLRKLAKKRMQGLGFGYDGLTQAELQELQELEEEHGERSFVRLPRHPPSLSAIALLPPITILSPRPGVDMSDAQRETICAPPLDSDPAPEYERGEFHWPGSKEDVKQDREAGRDGDVK
ncbi:hypothetical protein B0H16DRAFT_326718 [Mycena metata]|uniref:Transmembrane protein n=1 Tax=Mycena metata TaxID=1033252 RepID=A0AAD7MN04_9AGAR|nr:hypothetical protein B0H16DRAFT_326718 [Mycena metata]